MTDLPTPEQPTLAAKLIAGAALASEHRTRYFHVQLTPAEDGVRRALRHADYANAVLLRDALGEHGWPGRTLVGVHGAHAAWQIALHADHKRMLQCGALRLLQEAVQQDQAPVRQWAHLHDRCLVHSGAQEYGTQYRWDLASVERHPVIDEDSLDERRDRVGLGPAAAALQTLRRRLSTTSDITPTEPEPEPEPHRDDRAATTAELLIAA